MSLDAPEFAEAPASAEVVDVPEVVVEAPAPIAFEASSRQFRAEFTPDEWAAMPEGARAKVEALGRTLGDLDGGFRAVTGKLDSAREAAIAAEARAKAFEEMRAQPARQEAPQYSEAQLAQAYTAWAERANQLRNNGMDSSDAEMKAAAIRGALAQRQEAARETQMREAIRAEMRGVLDSELAPVREMRAAQVEDRQMGEFAQSFQMPKAEVERIAARVDAMLVERWQTPLPQIRAQYSELRHDAIASALIGARAGIAGPARVIPGSGAQTRPNPGLPSQGSRSAGMTPTAGPTNGNSMRPWKPSLFSALEGR